MNNSAPYSDQPSGSKPFLRRPEGEQPVAASGFSTEMSGQLAADLQTLREQEMNLRDYETRLRNWQAQIDAALMKPPVVAVTGSGSPFMRPASSSPFSMGGEGSLEAAWEKFHRARGLLEAEQHQMRDDRIVLREMELAVKRREEELAEREAALAERERLLAEAIERSPASAVQRLTQAPFVAAKAIFSSRK